MNLLLVIKVLFSIFLFSSFLILFGLPSLKKYNAREVFISRRKIDVNTLPPPAITFCVQKSGSAWKLDTPTESFENYDYESVSGHVSNLTHLEINDAYDYANIEEVDDIESGIEAIEDTEVSTVSTYWIFCSGYNTTDELALCIKQMTYSHQEIISDAVKVNKDYSSIVDIQDPSYWIDDISFADMGRCHTLNNSVSMGALRWKFMLQPHLNYTVLIHDPQYFLLRQSYNYKRFISMQMLLLIPIELESYQIILVTKSMGRIVSSNTKELSIKSLQFFTKL